MLLHIGGFLTHSRDLYHFTLVCRRLHLLLNKRLYCLELENTPCDIGTDEIPRIWLHTDRFRGIICNSPASTLRKFLEAGLNANTELGWYPLLSVAVFEDRQGLVKLLLEHGANPNRENELVMNPLTDAGSEETLVLLLEAGSNPNGTGAFGCSLLEHWVVLANRGMVSALLRYGADPELAPWCSSWSREAQEVWRELVWPNRSDYAKEL
jgi:ankyrin repeat protein